MENSRLIVKNLPKKVTEVQLRQKFGEFGTLTDIKLVNKQNTQRRFCFIGFKSCSEAKSALEYLNNTYF
jgi:multiple RNA-binding domain-containing protein 1